MNSLGAEEWRAPRNCECDYCGGGSNKHAWSFFYFMKRAGDRVSWCIDHDEFVILRWEKANG